MLLLSSRCIIEKYVSDGERAICDIDNVSVDITQCYSLMTGVRTTSEDIITMYTPHQLNILLWKWALTVSYYVFDVIIKV